MSKLQADARTGLLRLTLALAIILILPMCHAIADPDANIRWLISKPFSLMDWGIVELTRRLNGTFIPQQPSPVSVIADMERAYRLEMLGHRLEAESAFASYDWSKNRIIMRIGISRSDAAPTAEDCQFALRRSRQRVLLGYVGEVSDLSLRQNRVDAAEVYLSEIFRHPGGYSDVDEPAGIFIHLAEISTMHVSMHKLGDDNVLRNINCNGSLLDEDIHLELHP